MPRYVVKFSGVVTLDAATETDAKNAADDIACGLPVPNVVEFVFRDAWVTQIREATKE